MDTVPHNQPGTQWQSEQLQEQRAAQQLTSAAQLAQFLQEQQQAGLTNEQLQAIAGSLTSSELLQRLSLPAAYDQLESAAQPQVDSQLPQPPSLVADTYGGTIGGAESAARPEASPQQHMQPGDQSAALAELQQLMDTQRRAGEGGGRPPADNMVADILLAMAQNQDNASLRQLLALHQSAAGGADTATAAAAGAAGGPADATVAAGAAHSEGGNVGAADGPDAALAPSIGNAANLAALHAASAGLQTVGLPSSSYGPAPEPASAAADGSAAETIPDQGLHTLQLVQLPNGLQAALQPGDLFNLLQQQQLLLQQQQQQQQSGSAPAVEDGGYLDQMHEHAAKRQRVDAGPDAASHLAGLQGTADAAAAAAGINFQQQGGMDGHVQHQDVAGQLVAYNPAAASTAATSASAANGLPASEQTSHAQLAALAALGHPQAGLQVQQHAEAGSTATATALGTLVNVGGVNMLIPAASQLQLAALTPEAQAQNQLLALQQQVQLAQLPVVPGLAGVPAEGLAAAGGLDVHQLQLHQQLQQIQQLQQLQLMHLQLATQQGIVLAPGARLDMGLGLDDAPAAGHMVRRHGVLPERLVTRDMLKQVFHLPIEEAAKQLGIGQTMLKHYCRKFGIPRWPYRKRQSVVQLIQSIEDYAQAQDRPYVEPALQKLRTFLVQIDEEPNIDLDGPIKRLRQAFFKEAYKSRVRKQQDGDDSRGRGRSGQRSDGWLENLCQAIVDSHPDTDPPHTSALTSEELATLGDAIDDGYQDGHAAAAAAAAAGSADELAAVAAMQHHAAAAAGLDANALAAVGMAAAAQLGLPHAQGQGGGLEGQLHMDGGMAAAAAAAAAQAHADQLAALQAAAVAGHRPPGAKGAH